MIDPTYLNRFGPKMIAKYEALSDDQRRVVDARFERHRKACEKSGIGPDPLFLWELMIEIEEGRIAV